MEMIKKMMEAVTHLMKSFGQKEKQLLFGYNVQQDVEQQRRVTISGQRKPWNRSLNLVEYAKSRNRATRNSSRGTVTKGAAEDAAKHTNATKDKAYGERRLGKWGQARLRSRQRSGTAGRV